VSVSLTVDDAQSVPDIVAELRRLGTVSVESGRAIVCVVGEGLRTTPGIAARVFATVTDINVSLISQGASASTSLSSWTKRACAMSYYGLHEALFERDGLDLDPAAAAGELAP